MEMNRLTRDGTAEPVSRDQILRRERGQGNVHFSCSADHQQNRQVDPYTAIFDDNTYMYTVTADYPETRRECGRDQGRVVSRHLDVLC